MVIHAVQETSKFGQLTDKTKLIFKSKFKINYKPIKVVYTTRIQQPTTFYKKYKKIYYSV